LLHVACKTENEGIVALLIDHGIDLDATNKDGLTPLHLAAKFGCIDIARLLCTAGCDIDKANRGIRADVTAIKYGYADIANLLDKLRNVS
jgi:ankyrin repeat protein